MRTRLVAGSLVVFLAVSASWAATPLGTAFTYQGRLKDAGSPANGPYDLRFRLYDAVSGGAPVGAVLCLDNVSVTDGLFTVPLDFGAQFAGQERFLEIEVRADTGLGCANSAGFVTLGPRQALSAAPNALFASNADQLDGLNSTAFLQAVPVPLTLSGTSTTHIIRGENASAFPGAVAISGQSTAVSGQTFGVLGQSQSTEGSGVVGTVSSGTGQNFGVWGRSDSTSGRGVFGQARAGTGNTYGVYGESASTNGRGVLAYAAASSGTAYGVYAISDSTSGIGVFGQANSNSSSGVGVYGLGNSVGVYGQSDSSVGRGVVGDCPSSIGAVYGVRGVTQSTSFNAAGVYGSSNATSGNNYGVFGDSASTTGRGVLGSASATTGLTAGGRFASASTDGRGVWASATAASGATYGVFGECNSPLGRAVYGLTFGGGDAVFGEAGSASGRGCVGYATATSGVNYGVWGQSNSSSGFDFYAAGAGVNYGAASSKRWKSNIEPIGQPLDKLSRLRGVYFTWDAKHGGRHDLGMIAEEVGAVLPEIVGYEENGVDAVGMDYSKMTPLLVQAVKALRAEKDAELAALRAEKDAQICGQQEKINELTARLERLEKVISQTNH